MTSNHNTPLAVQSQPISLTNLGSLASEMVYRLPGCADLMIRKELQHAAIDFCRRSGAFIVEIEALFDENDVAALDVTYSAFVKNVLSARIGNVMLRPESYRVTPGDPPFLTLMENMFLPADEQESVVVEASLVPKSGCEDFPDDFLNRYGTGIVHGAMFRLHSMRGRPWADPTHATLEATEYQNALNDAALNVRRRGIGPGDLNSRNQTPWVIY
jgi:hypothetical protein